MNAKLCKKLRWIARQAAATLPAPKVTMGVPDWVIILSRARHQTQIMYHRGKCMRGIYLWLKQRVRDGSFAVKGSIAQVRAGTGLSTQGADLEMRKCLRQFGNPHWYTGAKTDGDSSR